MVSLLKAATSYLISVDIRDLLVGLFVKFLSSCYFLFFFSPNFSISK